MSFFCFLFLSKQYDKDLSQQSFRAIVFCPVSLFLHADVGFIKHGDG